MNTKSMIGKVQFYWLKFIRSSLALTGLMELSLLVFCGMILIIYIFEVSRKDEAVFHWMFAEREMGWHMRYLAVSLSDTAEATVICRLI